MHSSEDLLEEMKNFECYARYHVPWHLRPNFIDSKCLFGVKNGILVGSFVEPSESFWAAALRGDGPGHIRSLFGETLKVLRQETLNSGEDSRSLVAELEKYARWSKIDSSRVEAAGGFDGPVHLALALWRKLLNLSPIRWRESAIHGDLHGENVRVRKQDAIVIDFAHAAKGPMSADLGSLDVWLAFKIPAAGGIPKEQWRTEVEALYRPETIKAHYHSHAEDFSSSWLEASLSTIRRLSKDSTYSCDEYLRIVAVYLLRFASFPPDPHALMEDEFHRTYAYWLANRLVIALCQIQAAELERA